MLLLAASQSRHPRWQSLIQVLLTKENPRLQVVHEVVFDDEQVPQFP